MLDLTNERGDLAWLMFVQLEAEVLAVEPNGGSPARRLGPVATPSRTSDFEAEHVGRDIAGQLTLLDELTPRFEFGNCVFDPEGNALTVALPPRGSNHE